MRGKGWISMHQVAAASLPTRVRVELTPFQWLHQFPPGMGCGTLAFTRLLLLWRWL